MILKKIHGGGQKMNDYTKRDFYHFYDQENNQRRYYLKVRGAYIEVEKAVYYTCYNSYRKQLRDEKKDHDYHIVSYDKPMPNGNSLLECHGEDHDMIEEIYKKDMMKAIMNLLESLDEEDKKLIIDILINDRKERELAEEYQISQQMVSKRKGKILKNLKELLKDGCEKIKSLLF